MNPKQIVWTTSFECVCKNNYEKVPLGKIQRIVYLRYFAELVTRLNANKHDRIKRGFEYCHIRRENGETYLIQMYALDKL